MTPGLSVVRGQADSFGSLAEHRFLAKSRSKRLCEKWKGASIQPVRKTPSTWSIQGLGTMPLAHMTFECTEMSVISYPCLRWAPHTRFGPRAAPPARGGGSAPIPDAGGCPPRDLVLPRQRQRGFGPYQARPKSVAEFLDHTATSAAEPLMEVRPRRRISPDQLNGRDRERPYIR